MDEIFDVVDENNNVVGKAARKECHTKGLWHRAVHIIIVNSKGEMLLQKRAGDVYFPHYWDISAAGHVNYGQSFLRTAKRELKEELGLSVPLQKIRKIGSFSIPSVRYHYILYTAIYKGKNRIAGNREVSGLKWIRARDAKRITKSRGMKITPWLRYIMKHYAGDFEQNARQ